MTILVMGVAGSGKTTVARALARRLGWRFFEGDDYHSPASIQKMSRGIPLTDQDRADWLATLHRLILTWTEAGQDAVLASSALKRSYREKLREDTSPRRLQLIYLEVPFQTAARRMHERLGHFMPESLLQSQFDALEPPAPEEALRVDGQLPVESIVDEVIERLKISPRFPDSAAGDLANLAGTNK